VVKNERSKVNNQEHFDVAWLPSKCALGACLLGNLLNGKLVQSWHFGLLKATFAIKVTWVAVGDSQFVRKICKF